MQGVVSGVQKDFFHAIVGDERVFCHTSECDFEVEDLMPGDLVSIESLDSTPRGLRGRQITFLERPRVSRLPVFEGTVVFIDHSKMIGFARADPALAVGTNRSSDDTFFHVSSFPDNERAGHTSPTFERLSRGDRIRGLLRETTKGPRLESVELVAS